MKYLKRILSAIFEPIRIAVNRGFSERTIKLFNVHKSIIYIVAFIITVIIFLIPYLKF